MDHFKEEIIVRKKRGWFNLFLTAVTLSMIAAGIMAAVCFYKIQGTIMTSGFSAMEILKDVVMFVLFAAVVVGLFYVRVNIRVEYEYAFTNGELDVDKVVNGTKRQHLHSINIRKIERMAPVEDDSYKTYDSDQVMKRTYAMINRTSQIYFLIWGEGEARQMLLFEPSAEMARMMKLYNARAITLAPGAEEA